MKPKVHRLAVIGDVGGHLDELSRALGDLGADLDRRLLPDDLIVIQVGDLIHRGPDSSGVLQLVNLIMSSQPHQWVQLAGNHEAQYLTPEPAFVWDEPLVSKDADLLRGWWAKGWMGVAAAIRTPVGPFLVTHAGLTSGFWEALDRPETPEHATRLLNAAIGTPSEQHLFRAGHMLNGGEPDLHAGPLWANAATELPASWLYLPTLRPMFGQIHGHSSPRYWNRRSWNFPPLVKLARPALDEGRRHTKTEIGGCALIGVDPQHASRPAPSWAPLVFPEAILSESRSIPSPLHQGLPGTDR